MSITLTDRNGELVSVLEIPAHASCPALRRILSGVRALAHRRGFTVHTSGLPVHLSAVAGVSHV